ncbi:leucine-rich repeat isoform f [Anaeramoeba flamelloides]|uniref:Leucine-rich repeat isoform f n=1 Tax=Anaeramoeba flamelloides TaxID=1746091 RepID=A0AAV7YZD1_9EUKA|nr:leucine-rich repeat isoform f [Anaeramoeba flamelloides]
MRSVSKKEREYYKKQLKFEAKILKKQLAEQKKTEKLLKKQEKIHRKRQKTKKISFDKLKDITIEERIFVEGIVETVGEQVIFSKYILKKKSFQKFEHRILVLTKYRVITVGKRKKSLKKKICRNGHLFNLKKIEFFDDTHFKLYFKDFFIDIYHPDVIDFLDQIRENYFKIVNGFPEEKLCKFNDYSVIVTDCSSESTEENVNFNFQQSLRLNNVNNHTNDKLLNKYETNKQGQKIKNDKEKEKGDGNGLEKEKEIEIIIENENEKKNISFCETVSDMDIELGMDMYIGVGMENDCLNYYLNEGERKRKRNKEKNTPNERETCEVEGGREKEKEKEKRSKIKDKKKKLNKKISSKDLYLPQKNIRNPSPRKSLKMKSNKRDILRTKSFDTFSDIQRSDSLWGFKNQDYKAYPGNGIDIYPIISALKYNDYFREFKLTNVYRKDPITLLSYVLESNYSIEKVTLSGLESYEGFARFGQAVRANPNCQLTYLDLSGNKITKNESKKFANGLKCLNELRTLNLSFCGLVDSSLSNIIEGVRGLNKFESLNLSGNKFGSKSTNLLTHLLSIKRQKNKTNRKMTLQLLMLDFTGIRFKPISAALYHSHIQYLSFIGNNFSQDDTYCLIEVLKEIQNLKHLDLSSCNLTKEILVAILDSILSNEKLCGFRLSASNNPLGAEAGKMLLQLFEMNRKTSTLRELILDNNELGAIGIKHLLRGVKYLKSLKKLSISRNIFKGVAVEELQEPLINLLIGSSITHLRWKGNERYFLGKWFPKLLKGITHIQNFTILDLSKNHFEAEGLSIINDLLSKNILKVNCLFIDNNNFTLSTLENFMGAIHHNNYLTFGKMPECDIAQIIKSSDKRSKNAVQKHINTYRNSFLKKLSLNRKKLNIKTDKEFMISADGIDTLSQKELFFYINNLFFSNGE